MCCWSAGCGVAEAKLGLDTRWSARVSIDVYNLEFRSWSGEIKIAGYHCKRASDYRTQVQNLHHQINIHSEFSIKPNTGTHCITASVQPPQLEPPAVLPWTPSQPTALDDITLLLSIFTTRHVFAWRHDSSEKSQRVIVAESRQFPWGGLIATSIPYVSSSPPHSKEYPHGGDVGLEVHLNQVWQLMNSDGWREKYRSSFYLILFRSAIQQSSIESAFIQCWTIWEHLFSILNESWMTQK